MKKWAVLIQARQLDPPASSKNVPPIPVLYHQNVLDLSKVVSNKQG